MSFTRVSAYWDSEPRVTASTPENAAQIIDLELTNLLADPDSDQGRVAMVGMKYYKQNPSSYPRQYRDAMLEVIWRFLLGQESLAPDVYDLVTWVQNALIQANTQEDVWTVRRATKHWTNNILDFEKRPWWNSAEMR